MKLNKHSLTSGKAVVFALAFTLFVAQKINGQNITRDDAQSSKKYISTNNCRIEKQSCNLSQNDLAKKLNTNASTPSEKKKVIATDTEITIKKEQLPNNTTDKNNYEINALPANSEKN